MAAKTRTFEELIFSEGQWAELAYVIKSGRVEIFLDRADNESRSVRWDLVLVLVKWRRLWEAGERER